MNDAGKKVNSTLETSEIKPKYSCISISIPADFKDKFLLECKRVGLHADMPIFLSVDPSSTIEVIFKH